jgi:enoyl-CoA hydratase
MTTVLVETVGATRVLTLNRPEKLNAANFEMQAMLLAELRAAAADRDLRALVLTGAGRAFSAGGDRSILQEMAAGTFAGKEEFGRVHIDTIMTLLELEIPAIAAVNGHAVGYAAGLVALCDVVVMGESGFLCDPHVRYGIPATTAAQMVWPRLCSELVARELLMSGRQVGAEEALRIGLCNRNCPDGDERQVALEVAEGFTSLPRSGIAETKRAFNAPLIAEATRIAIPAD